MTVITDPVEQYNLITKGLQETLNGQIIKDVLEKKIDQLKSIGEQHQLVKPHCGYFVPMIKLAHF